MFFASRKEDAIREAEKRVWNPRPGGEIDFEQTDGQHDSRAQTIQTSRTEAYEMDAEGWH
jgi:hypothetical protein